MSDQQDLRILINDKLTDIAELKVTELKVELKKRGVSTAGTKKDLYEKLKNVDLSLVSDVDNTVNEKSELNESVNTSTAEQNGQTEDTVNGVHVKRTHDDNQAIEGEELQSKRAKNEDEQAVVEAAVEQPQVVEVEMKQPEAELVVDVPVSVAVSEAQEEATAAAVAVPPPVDDDKTGELNLTLRRSISSSQLTDTESTSRRSYSRDRSSSIDLLNVDKQHNAVESRASSKSESAIKEVPMSGERNRFSRSRSPKSRWHASPTPDPESVDGQLLQEAKAVETPMVTETATETEVSVTEAPQAEGVVCDEKKDAEQPVDASSDIPKVQRKRKWFSSDSQKNVSKTQSVTISSDTLKSYLPEAKLPKSLTDDTAETTTTTEVASVGEASGEEPQVKTNGVRKASDTPTDDQNLKRQSSRTVIIEDEHTELIYEDATELNKSTNSQAATNEPAIKEPKKTEPLKSSTDEPERVGDASPARNQATTIIHVKGLTRPFTINQLKELLSKHGKLVDTGFWMDNVKSHCYAAFEDVDGAKAAREALHRTRWPQSNPRLLRVDFATEEELLYHQNGDEKALTVTQNKKHQDKESQNGRGHKDTQNGKDDRNHHKENKEPTATKQSDGKARRSTSRHREKDGARGKRDERPVREWDIPKLRGGSRSRSRDVSVERKRRDQEKRKTDKKEEEPVVEEPPAKLLDDLFKKTKATPYIYWLPLTDETLVEKEQQREKRLQERKLREIEREKKRELENEALKANGNGEQYHEQQQNGRRSRSRSNAKRNSVERKNESSDRRQRDERTKRDESETNKRPVSSRQPQRRSRSTDRRRERR